jgi:transposase
MRQQEMLVLSKEDRDRLKVLHEAEKGHIRQREAGRQLGIGERWVRKLLARKRKEGDGGVVHRLRGRPSNRKVGEKVQQRAVKLVGAKYRDVGPTLAAEYLAERHQVRVSKETLRRWLMEAGLWKARRRKVEEVHVWRPRRLCRGELVQWDTSEHDWLEGRGPKLYLVAMVDDATSRAMARFVEHDSVEENLKLLGRYLEDFGRPVEFYTDKGSLFSVNQSQRHEEDEGWEEARTQIGRALKELGIGWIAAHSPQAKGRIERFFGTAQDRLVKGLRIARVSTLKAANDYLEQEYLPLWNRRFTVEPTKAANAHRGLEPEHDLAAILSHVEERVVTNDYTIRYGGRFYQIGRAEIRPGLRGGVVRVERRLDGTIGVRFRDRYLKVTLCAARPERSEPRQIETAARNSSVQNKGKPRRLWMEHFDLQQSLPLWQVLQQEGGGDRRGAAPVER